MNKKPELTAEQLLERLIHKIRVRCEERLPKIPEESCHEYLQVIREEVEFDINDMITYNLDKTFGKKENKGK